MNTRLPKSPLLLALFVSTLARGAGPTFVVNDTSDAHDLSPGDGKCDAAVNVCTLRAAVEEANKTMDATVQVPAGTFTLSLGALVLTSPMSIVGAGMTATVISGNNTSGVFTLAAGTGASISDLTIRDGNAIFGGGIYAAVPLTMDRCLVTYCTALVGGGIFGTVGRATRSAITHCTATGGDFNAVGGGVFGEGTFAGCTFSMNYAALDGGAICASGVTNVVNCTLSFNTAGQYGGGIYVSASIQKTVRLYNSTVASNLAVTYGGGIATDDATGAYVQFVDSIIADNHRTVSHIMYDDDCAGTLTSLGNSILHAADPTHCAIYGSFSTADPLLGPLQDNGGPTQTRALLEGSPAINAGNPLGCGDESFGVLTTDQRGVDRPVGSACDIGAYERSPCGDLNGDGAVNVSDVFSLINYLFAGGAFPPGLANVNGDSTIDVGDVFYLINALFAGGSAPSCAGT
jgi:predicted outer membrane repeat protein